MFFVREESFILDDMKKAFKKYKKFNYLLYHECKKSCKAYGIEQLYHAKAVLEERQMHGTENNNGIAYTISLISVAITVLTLWISALTDQFKQTLDFSLLFVVGLIVCVCVFVLIVVHDNVIAYHRKNAYFYSIICDEISDRSK